MIARFSQESILQTFHERMIIKKKKAHLAYMEANLLYLILKTSISYSLTSLVCFLMDFGVFVVERMGMILSCFCFKLRDQTMNVN